MRYSHIQPISATMAWINWTEFQTELRPNLMRYYLIKTDGCCGWHWTKFQPATVFLDTASYPAFHSVKVEGHIFHFVIFYYWEKFLTNFFENEPQFIWCYEVRILFFLEVTALRSPHWAKLLTWTENCPDPQGKLSQKCKERDIMCIV